MLPLILFSLLVSQSFGQNILEDMVGSDDYSAIGSTFSSFPVLNNLLSNANAALTVFAPSNIAVTNAGDLPSGDALEAILGAHILTQKLSAADLFEQGEVDTEQFSTQGGSILTTSSGGGKNYVCGTNCAEIDDPATEESGNGLVHGINAILSPLPNTTGMAAVVSQSEIHTTLASLLAENAGAATSTGTLFAPNDAAFAALEDALVFCLRKTPSEISGETVMGKVLLYHQVPALKVFSWQLNPLVGAPIPTQVADQTTSIKAVSGGFTVNDIVISAPNLIGANGIVHSIDGVLVPTGLGDCESTLYSLVQASSDSFYTGFVGAVESQATVKTGLEQALKITAFIPSTDAFGNLPSGTDVAATLLNHVTADLIEPTDSQFDKVYNTLATPNFFRLVRNAANNFICTTGCVRITGVQSEIGNNGIAHQIEGVLTGFLPTTTSFASIVSGSPQHTTLLKLLVAEDAILKSLDSASPLTLFAPTDAAFSARFTEDQLDCLVTPQNRAILTKVLQTHVFSSTRFSFQLVNNAEYTSLSGERLRLALSQTVVVSTSQTSATVTTADLHNVNGVLHIVDNVLLPANLGDIVCGSSTMMIPSLFLALAVVLALFN